MVFILRSFDGYFLCSHDPGLIGTVVQAVFDKNADLIFLFEHPERIGTQEKPVTQGKRIIGDDRLCRGIKKHIRGDPANPVQQQPRIGGFYGDLCHGIAGIVCIDGAVIPGSFPVFSRIFEMCLISVDHAPQMD